MSSLKNNYYTIHRFSLAGDEGIGRGGAVSAAQNKEISFLPCGGETPPPQKCSSYFCAST